MSSETNIRSGPPRRAVPAMLAAVLALSALPAASPAEPLSPTSPLYSPSAPLVDENPYVSAEYSGTLTQTSVTSTVPTQSVSANLSWNTKVSGPVDQIEYAATYGASAIHWEVTELSGSVKVIKEKSSCSGSFSATSKDGGTRGVELPLDEPGFPAGGGNPATNPDYRVDPPQGISLVLLASSAAPGECGTSEWNNSEKWFGAALSQPGWAPRDVPVRARLRRQRSPLSRNPASSASTSRYGPTVAARANAAKTGRQAELDAALDALCDEWNRGTLDDARFEMEYLLTVGTRV